MPEGTNTENLYSELSRKIDDQGKFTRMVCIICSLAIIGVIFYSLTSIVNTLPDVVLARFMGNMEQIANEWKLINGSTAPAANSLAAPTSKTSPKQ